LDDNNVEANSVQEYVTMMDNNDQRDTRLYNSLRVRHEYTVFVQYIERIEAGRDSVKAFQEIQEEDHDWDQYPYPPITKEEVNGFNIFG
jgi:hypothetical protein